jgi:CheY-like chemotaxis protein
MPSLARNSIRILHVDDDDAFAELSAHALQRAGFKQPVTRCRDGLLAVNYFSKIDRATAPHVILLDLHMPGMNGLDVLRWLRQNYDEKNVAIYLLTSSQDPLHKSQAAAYGVTDFLLKSASAHRLIEKLDALIAMSEGTHEPDAGT